MTCDRDLWPLALCEPSFILGREKGRGNTGSIDDVRENRNSVLSEDSFNDDLNLWI